MRYTTKIELPVATAKSGNYVLTKYALEKLIDQLKTRCNVINIEWHEGNCTATIEMFSPVELESEPTSFELFVRDMISQVNRKNLT